MGKLNSYTHQLTDSAFPKVVFCSIEMPQADTTSSADKTKLLSAWSDGIIEEDPDIASEVRDGAYALI